MVVEAFLIQKNVRNGHMHMAVMEQHLGPGKGPGSSFKNLSTSNIIQQTSFQLTIR